MQSDIKLTRKDIENAVADYLKSEGYLFKGDPVFTEYEGPTGGPGNADNIRFCFEIDIQPSAMAAKPSSGGRTSKVRDTLLSHFSEHPKDVTTPETLAVRYGISTGAINTALKKLVDEGFVNKPTRGQYQWNEALPTSEDDSGE